MEVNSREANNRYEISKQVSIVSLVTNTLLSIAKIIVGVIFRSNALVADGIHSVSDVASTLMVFFSLKISQTPPDEEHPYGHGKAESIATTLLGLILIVTGLLIVKNTIVTIMTGDISVPGKLVLWIAGLSIITKEWLYRYTLKQGERITSKGLIADAHHHRSDAFSSIAALIGAGGARLGYPILDPVAGLIVALLVTKIGGEIFLEALDELMDAVPNQEKIDQMISEVNSLNNVIKVGDIKLRSYGPRLVVDVEVVVDNYLSVIEGHKVAVNVKEKIKKSHPNVKRVLVHIDPEAVYQQK